MNETQASYDAVAADYAEHVFDELANKPMDRCVLNQFAEMVQGLGPVCDLGCGPGQIARYLRACGVTDVFGLDLSPGMVAQAQRLNPEIEFQQGDMQALTAADNAWGGVAAFYSIIHIPRAQVTQTLRELNRVLRLGGWLLLSFHVGDQVEHVAEWWNKPVALDFTYFQRAEMENYLTAAEFEVKQVCERQPYPQVEYQSQRVYILARKPEPS